MPQIQRLENRELFAAVEAFQQNNAIYVYGTGDADIIEIRYEANRVSIDGVSIRNAAGMTVESIPRNEVQYGTYVFSLGGDDTVRVHETPTATALPAVLFGGSGNDTLIGGSNNDAILGMEGIDFIDGKGGNDVLYGSHSPSSPLGDGRNTILGGAGNDEIWGADNIDLLFGQAGDDRLFGLNGADVLDGGTGINQVDGGAGIDMIQQDLNNPQITLTNSTYIDGLHRTTITGIEDAKLNQTPGVNQSRIDARQFSGRVGVSDSVEANQTQSLANNGVLMFTGGLKILSFPKTVAPEITALYNSLNGNNGSRGLLGLPVGQPIYRRGGQEMKFERGGSILFHPTTGAYYLPPGLLQKYNELGGPDGTLGFPKSAFQSRIGSSGIRYMTFEKGILILSGGKTLAITGNFYDRWNALGGFGKQGLGLPLSDETIRSDGSHLQHFQTGMLINNDGFGNPAAIYDEFVDVFGVSQHVNFLTIWSSSPKIQADLGYPTSDVHRGPMGGRYITFERGVMLWRPTGQVQIVQGLIYEEYWNQGGPSGFLGYPVSNETKSGTTNNHTYRSLFENGRIVYQEGPKNWFVWKKQPNGTHVIHWKRVNCTVLEGPVSYYVCENNEVF